MDKKALLGNPSAPRPNPLPGCPMAAAFAALGGKWKLTLLYWLAHGESHFAGLRRRAAPITANILVEQLRELQADGLIERLETGPVPAPVLCRLTPYWSAVLPRRREHSGLGRGAPAMRSCGTWTCRGDRLRRRRCLARTRPCHEPQWWCATSPG